MKGRSVPPEWADAFDRGRRAHPEVPLDSGTFLREAESRFRPSAGAASGGRGGDLFLAVACDLGTAGAWEALAAEYRPRLLGLLRRRRLPDALTREVLDELPGHLCAPPARGGARTRIGTWNGGGSLFSWLAVVTSRLVADRAARNRELPLEAARAPSRPGAGEDSVSGLHPESPALPPSRIVVEAEKVDRFEEALQEALVELTPRERLAVLLKFRDGLPQVEIARLLRVTPSRVTRLLQAGTERLASVVHDRLEMTPPGTAEEALWFSLADAVARLLSTAEESPVDPVDGGSDA